MYTYPDDQRVWGVDISHWQDNPNTPQGVDFEKLKAEGCSFIFIRAGIGTSIDHNFTSYWHAAKMVDLPRGAYWFLDAGVGGGKQANVLKQLLLSDPGEIRPIVDVEHTLVQSITSTHKGKTQTVRLYNTASQIREFLSALNFPYPPMVYTSHSYWTEHIAASEEWAWHPLWVAHYGVEQPRLPLPWRDWTFWQFTDNGPGKVMGMESLEVDLDYFNGTQFDFQKFLTTGTALPPTPTEERNRVLDEVVTVVEGMKK